MHSENRSEPRKPAPGQVELRRPQMPGDKPFQGCLEDVSSGGFRARHNCFSLGTGETVLFELKGRSGLACSMWTRILGDQFETGFRICQEH